LEIVRETQDHLWCTIEAGLDIREALLTAGAARPKVNDLHFLLLQIAIKDVFRLQVTVDDPHMLEVDEAFNDLEGYGLDLRTHLEALELVVFQVEIQILPQELKDHTIVASEEETFTDSDDFLLVVLHRRTDLFLVIYDSLPNLLQDADLHTRVVVVERCVPVYLDGNLPKLLVVITLHNLPKSTFVDFFYDLESILKVVSLDHFVEAPLGVETMVILARQDSLHVPHLLSLLRPSKVNVRISIDLLPFIGSQLVCIVH